MTRGCDVASRGATLSSDASLPEKQRGRQMPAGPVGFSASGAGDQNFAFTPV
jgi:hypothetical protein